MSKIAFLFPGQGSQAAGMGKRLFETSQAARRVFEEADDTLGFALSRLCFEGPDSELKLTENTQPAILAVSVAADAALEEQGIRPDYVAGHSLGEYSALVSAGSLSFPEALMMVRNRGRYMQDAVPEGIGGMAAILRLPDGKLDELLEEASQGEVVSAANLNSPEQIVIAGHLEAVKRAVELAKAAGARKAVLLKVSAPFHCALMTPAQQRLKSDLDSATFHNLRVPLINNWEAREIHTGAEAREGLFQQVPHPVRWTESIQHLASQGVDRFKEVGPGTVLAGLVRTILPGVVVESAG